MKKMWFFVTATIFLLCCSQSFANITGQVTYTGTQTGQLYIVAFSASGGTCTAANLSGGAVFVTPPSPWPYAYNIATGFGNYCVGAFLDVAGTGSPPDLNDPKGLHNAVVTDGAINVDIQLFDPNILNGTWVVGVNVNITAPIVDNCTYGGSAEVYHFDALLYGMVNITWSSGSPLCPTPLNPVISCDASAYPTLTCELAGVPGGPYSSVIGTVGGGGYSASGTFNGAFAGATFNVLWNANKAQASFLDYPEVAFQKKLITPPNNQTAGTILSNPEGRGDVLIFPYYDVRVIGGKAQDTLFAIINENFVDTTWGGVAAKLRFREWDKSEECFDVDIWLSDNDVWVGALTRNTVTGVTRITSPDQVITDFTTSTFTLNPILAAGWDFSTTLVPGGSGNPKAPPAGFTAADLTNMGYFELIGEERTYTSASSGKVTRLPSPPNPAAWTDCPNTLSGYAYIVRVSDGVAMGYNATAIGNFSRNQGSLFAGPGSTLPSLAQCEDGLDQLEFELSREKMYHGYDISAAIGGKFSLIVTFPTKHFHFQGRPTYTIWASPAAPPLPPPNAFGPPFTGANANAGEEIDIGIFDRNEVKWLPPVSPKPLWKLLFEVNILSLYTTQIPPTLPAIGERDTLGLSTWQPTTPPFESGWIWVGLGWVNRPPLALVHQGNALWGPWGHLDPINGFFAYHGLPALGLALQEFTNGLLGGYYGEIFPAFYKVDWLRIN